MIGGKIILGTPLRMINFGTHEDDYDSLVTY